MKTGLSRPQQILYFFEQHQEGTYSTNYISQYICNNFDLSSKPQPKYISMLQQINNEVASNISKFLDPKYKTNPIYNFERTKIGKDFFYSYKENYLLTLPTTIETNKENKYFSEILIAPTQTNFDFEQIQETTTEEEQTLSILQEDIIAADYVNSLNDPFLLILDKIEKLNMAHLKDISLSTIIRDKKISINISNF